MMEQRPDSTYDNNYGVYSGGMNFEGIDPPLIDPYFVRDLEARLREEREVTAPLIESSVIEGLITEYQSNLARVTAANNAPRNSLSAQNTIPHNLISIANNISPNLPPATVPQSSNQSLQSLLTQISTQNSQNSQPPQQLQSSSSVQNFQQNLQSIQQSLLQNIQLSAQNILTTSLSQSIIQPSTQSISNLLSQSIQPQNLQRTLSNSISNLQNNGVSNLQNNGTQNIISSLQNTLPTLPQTTASSMTLSETRQLTQLTELNITNLLSVLSQASEQDTSDRDLLESNIDDLLNMNCDTSSSQAYNAICTASLAPSFAHRPTFVTANKTAAIPPTDSLTLPALATMHPTTSESPTNRFVMNNRDQNFVPDKRTKISRRNFSVNQIEGLEAVYLKHRFVKRDMRRELAKRLNLSERSVSYWFQNKRARSKDPVQEGQGLSQLKFHEISPQNQQNGQ